ncbi:MAG: glycosyltransferase family 2 protein [Clostridia bacterium]|nr:glycosyltransferase family 2 protein [Clostridia bacterium]
MEEKLVSVVVPTHSGYDNIKRAVSAVLEQSYTNLEVIVVDDNGRGTDAQIKTEKALEPLMSDKRLKYITHEVNINGSAARNNGMKHSRGEYIAFLDDDDIYEKDCIKTEVETLERLGDEYGIVFVSVYQTREGMKDKYAINDFDGYVIDDFLLGKVHSPSSVVMIRREVMDTVGLWDESFKRHQDWEYFGRIVNQYKAYGIKEVLVRRPILGRHYAKNVEVFVQNRIHYLDKMKDIIESRPKDIQTRIYDRHYSAISKEYFKKKKFGKCIKWSMKTSSPIRSFKSIATGAASYMKNKSE